MARRELIQPPSASSYPKCSGEIFINGRDIVVRQAIGGGVGVKASSIETAQAPPAARPENSLPVLIQAPYNVAGQPGAHREGSEFAVLQSLQAAARGNPQTSFAVFGKREYDVIQQT